MKNISLNKESINLMPNESYLIIDGLYLNDIGRALSNIDKVHLIKEIREKVFPYTDTPFAEFAPQKSEFSIDQIKKINYDDVVLGDKTVFSTDSGLIILLKKEILVDLASSFDYGNLVDSTEGPINIEYWERICSKYNQGEIGLILAPGINSESEFEGSGTYKVV